ADDEIDLVVRVEVEALGDLEAAEERRGEKTFARRRADEREGLELEANAASIGALVEHEIDAEVLHRGVKELLGFGRHAVDLVDEDDIAALDAGQDADEILAALEIGAEVRMEPHAKLGGDEVRERRLPESRHPGKEDVIEDLAACLRSVDREAEV